MAAKTRKYESEERINYTTDLGASICELVANGLALKEICLLEGMPSRTTAYKWLGQNAEFANMYARAREERADLIADEIVTIADTEPDANKARVRIDARKWWAAKINPKSYGDKAELNVTGDHKITHASEPVSETAQWVAGMLGNGKAGPPKKSLQS